MNISELGDEPFVVAYVVIEVPFLPEVRYLSRLCCLPSCLQRDFALEDLHEAWEQSGNRLTQQQVHMLRHYNVSKDIQIEAAPRLFQGQQECVFHVHLREEWKAVVTAECQEVSLSGAMKPFKSIRHKRFLN
jgi:hypothetical protein